MSSLGGRKPKIFSKEDDHVESIDDKEESILLATYLKFIEGAKLVASGRFMKELSIGNLYISDADLMNEESTTFCKFINTNLKLLKSNIRGIYLVRTKEMSKKKMKSKTSKLMQEAPVQSVLSFEKFKLFRLILQLMATCEALETVVLNNVLVSPEVIISIGDSLLNCPSENLRIFAVRDVYFGDEGMKELTGYLRRSRLKVLCLERCGLRDASAEYIAAIIKAQEAYMDTLFWNCTLRLDTNFGDTIPQANSLPFGVQALSVSGNGFTSKGIFILAKHLLRNQWLQAINFSNNEIDEDGIIHLAKALENNVTLHTLTLCGNPGYNLEIGITLDATAAVAHQKMTEASEAGTHDLFWKENGFSVPNFDMVSVLKKWRNEKDAPEVRPMRPEAIEITPNNPCPPLSERGVDPMVTTGIFRSEMNLAIAGDEQDGTNDLNEELDLGSTNWNDADYRNSEIGVDVFEYAVPFMQSPDKRHGNEADEVDDFVQSSTDIHDANEIERRPPSRISLRARKNNPTFSPNTSAEHPVSTIFPFEDGPDVDNKEDITRRRDGTNVDRPISAKNHRTVFSKSIGDCTSDGPDVLMNDDPSRSISYKLSTDFYNTKTAISRKIGDKQRPKTTGSISINSRKSESLRSKFGKQNSPQKRNKDISPSVTPGKTISEMGKKSTPSPDMLGRSLNSTSSGPSLLGRYLRSQSAYKKLQQDRSKSKLSSNKKPINSSESKVSPSKVRDVKVDMSKTHGGLSGRTFPQNQKSKVKTSGPAKKAKKKFDEVAPELVKSVPVSKYKTVSPRKASTPKSPTRMSAPASPIDQALQDLEETVAKRLNVAVNSVTANLEGFTQQLAANGSTFGSIDNYNKGKDTKFDLSVDESTKVFDDYYNDHMATLEKLSGAKVNKAKDRYKSSNRKSSPQKSDDMNDTGNGGYRNSRSKVENKVHWHDEEYDYGDDDDNDDLPPHVSTMVESSLKKKLTEKVTDIVHQLMKERGMVDSNEGV